MKARLTGKYLIDDLISIRLRIGIGIGSATAWGCDLSDQYVRINADYTTQTRNPVIAVSQGGQE